MIFAGSGAADVRISFNNPPFTTLEIFERGIRFCRFYNMGKNQFDVEIAITDF